MQDWYLFLSFICWSGSSLRDVLSCLHLAWCLQTGNLSFYRELCNSISRAGFERSILSDKSGLRSQLFLIRLFFRGCCLLRLVNNRLSGALRIPRLLLFLSSMDVLIQPAGVTRQPFSKLVWALYISGKWKKHPIEMALGTEELISKCVSTVSSFFPGSMSSAMVEILVQIYAVYIIWVIYAFYAVRFWVFENWCCW